MKDREAGTEMPQAGAPTQLPLPAAGMVVGSASAGQPPAERVAHAPPPHAAPQRSKRRRKRRRGRKVYAPDAVPGGLASANGVASGEPETRHDAAPAQPPPHHAPFNHTQLEPPPPAIVPAGARPFGEAPAFAALDLGTNNCRLLVAVPGRPGQFRVIDAFSRIVRLGEGLSSTGRLAEAAMDRAIAALRVCAEKLAGRPISRARLIATEACRSAANGQEFLARVEREAGLSLEIIDRETEARLAVSGCGSLVGREARGVVLFDIGGGSSEIALIDLAARRQPQLARNIVAWTSLPVGVVSLAERFGGRTVTAGDFAAMVAHVEGLLEGFSGRGKLAHVAGSRDFHLLGTSGTVTTLAGVHLDLPRYDRRRVDGLWMDDLSLDRMVDRLLSWSFEQRVANPCIGAERADLVLAGCAILQAIRRAWPSERLRVADRGLREGILSELMTEAGVWRRGRGRDA